MNETRFPGGIRTPKARTGVLLSLVLGLALAIPASASAGAFSLGVAAGEVDSDSAKLWGHADKSGKVTLEVAKNGKFKGKKVIEKQLEAKGGNDFTVQKTVKKLKPSKDYEYRFCRKGKCSDKGSFTTAPKAKSDEKISFALSGDADPTPEPGQTEPFFGNYLAFKAMRKENNDFNVFMGDTIYSDTGVDGPPATTVEEKWAKYRQNLGVKNLRKLRQSAALYSHWDDHEFVNDFTIPEDGEELYEAGVKAFADYQPISYSDDRGIYRTFRWGRNVEVFFLDERSFRDAKASAGGTCDNPDTNEPDLAPSLPNGKRTLFGVLAPSLNEPVSQACKNAINDPNRTMLGRDQFNRFLDDVESSTARWKVIFNETPIQQFYGLPYDRWEGYAHERIELLQQLEQRNVENLAFLTTDTHAAFANVIRERTFADDVAPSNAPAQPTDTPYSDYVIGPVATNTFFAEIDQVTGGEGDGLLLSQYFFKPAPPAGVGMDCAQGDVNSYAQIEASKSKLKIEYKDETGADVIDIDDSVCGPYVLER